MLKLIELPQVMARTAEAAATPAARLPNAAYRIRFPGAPSRNGWESLAKFPGLAGKNGTFLRSAPG